MDKIIKLLLLTLIVFVPLLANYGADQGTKHAGTGAVIKVDQGGNQDCPDGTFEAAKFEFNGGNYVLESSAPGVTVTISNGTSTGGDFSSTVLISHIVVKGGNGSVIDEVNPPSMTGSFTNANVPPVGNGNIPAISNIKFCSPVDVPPTDVPPTDVPPTDVPPTDVPPTDVPPTDVPPTDVPPTDVPPTDVPPTDVPPTDVPPTDVPPTDVPPTDVPPTDVPPTDVPPTSTPVPPTSTPVPPTPTPQGTVDVTPEVTPESTPDFSS